MSIDNNIRIQGDGYEGARVDAVLASLAFPGREGRAVSPNMAPVTAVVALLVCVGGDSGVLLEAGPASGAALLDLVAGFFLQVDMVSGVRAEVVITEEEIEGVAGQRWSREEVLEVLGETMVSVPKIGFAI